MTSTTSNAIAARDPRTERFIALRDFLEKRKGQISEVAGKTLDTKRVLKIVLDAAVKNPKLLDAAHANPSAMLRALLYCAQIGLEPVGAWGVHLVPFLGKNPDIVPVIDYRALIALVKRGDSDVRTVRARVAYEHDVVFDVTYGDEDSIEHKPQLDPEKRGKLIAVYAIAGLKGGEMQREVMVKAEVDAIRARSRAGGDGPWVTDYEAMAKKTVLKRLCKLLPVSIEVAEALEAEDSAFDPNTVTINAATGEVEEDDDRPASKADAIKADLRARREEQPVTTTIDAGPEPSPGTQPPFDTGEAPAGDEQWTREDTARLSDELDALRADLVELVGQAKSDALWNGSKGPGSLRGVRSKAHAKARLDAAYALLEAAKRGE